MALDRAIMLPHEFRLHSEERRQQDQGGGVDAEKLDSPDQKSFHEEDGHARECLPTMTSSLPMIYEEGQSPQPSSSNAHVMWPTDEVMRSSEV